MTKVGNCCLKTVVRFIALVFLIVPLIDLSLTIVCDGDLLRRGTHQNVVSVNHAIEILIDLSLLFVSFFLLAGSCSSIVLLLLLWLNAAPLFILADGIQIILDIMYHPELSMFVVFSCLMVLFLYMFFTLIVAVYYNRVTEDALHNLQDQDLDLITILPEGFPPEAQETSLIQPFQENLQGNKSGIKIANTRECLYQIHAGEPVAIQREKIHTTD